MKLRRIAVFLTLLSLSGVVCAQDEVPLDMDMDMDMFEATEAKFKGGEEARIRVVMENFKIPNDLPDSISMIRVYISFQVDTNGCVQNVRAMDSKNTTESLKEAGVEAVKQMRCYWIPGQLKGKPVAMNMRQPILIRLE